MVSIHISKDIEASQEQLWNIISDVDREPEFWHGTKSIKNIKITQKDFTDAINKIRPTSFSKTEQPLSQTIR